MNHERAITGGNAPEALQYPHPPSFGGSAPSTPVGNALYPSLTNYMGLQITPQMMQEMQIVPSQVRFQYYIHKQ